MPVMRKAFNIIRTTVPAFSGFNGLIDHSEGVGTLSGKSISASNSLRVAAIWIAATILADEIASLNIKLIEKDDKTRTPQQPPQLKALWSDDPNDDQTRFGIEATETLSMILSGAAYTALGWLNDGSLDIRWPIDPMGVTLERIDDGGGLRLKSAGQGELENRRGQRPQFYYAPMYVLPGQITPVSPVRMAAEMAGLSLAYQETAARFMGQGLNPSVVVTAEDVVDDAQATALSNRLTKLHGGSGRAAKVAVLGGKGLKIDRLTMSMADAEFIAQNEYVFKILLAMWRVPPTVAGMVDKPSTWGTGIAEFTRGLERFTLRPIVQRKQGAGQKYITRWVNESLQLKYQFDAFLSATPKERTDIQRTRLMNGTTSVERILALEDEPPFEEGETTFTQLALASPKQRDFAMMKDEANAIAAQATAVSNLVAAGVPVKVAWTILGTDPASLEDPDVPAIPAPAPEDVETAPGAPGAGGSGVQATALNGAQIASLLEIVVQVTNGTLSPDTARGVIEASFPSLEAELINRIVSSAESFEPTPPEPEVIEVPVEENAPVS